MQRFAFVRERADERSAMSLRVKRVSLPQAIRRAFARVRVVEMECDRAGLDAKLALERALSRRLHAAFCMLRRFTRTLQTACCMIRSARCTGACLLQRWRLAGRAAPPGGSMTALRMPIWPWCSAGNMHESGGWRACRERTSTSTSCSSQRLRCEISREISCPANSRAPRPVGPSAGRPAVRCAPSDARCTLTRCVLHGCGAATVVPAR